MTRWRIGTFSVLVILAGIVAASCTGPPPAASGAIDEPVVPEAPTETPLSAPTEAPALTPEQEDAVAQGCVDADSELIDQCREVLAFAAETWPGELAAVCQYVDGSIDVVHGVAKASEAEKECAAAGIVAVDRVVATVRLPE